MMHSIKRNANRLTAKIRAPLKKGEARRHAVVSEDDPARKRLVYVVGLRHPDPDHWKAGSQCDSDPTCCRKWKRECQNYALEHIGLAITYAKNLGSSYISQDDLTHAAVIGLMEAVKRFDVTKAGRFSTYAVWRMRYQCERLMYEDEAGIVKLPGQLRDDVRDVDQIARRLATILGTAPDDAQILAALQADEAEKQAKWEADPTGENKKPTQRWSKATAEKVRETRETYAGSAYAQLDPRIANDDETEKKLIIQQALGSLPPTLAAILADEFDIQGVDVSKLPTCPVARATGLQLGLNLLRRRLGG